MKVAPVCATKAATYASKNVTDPRVLVNVTLLSSENGLGATICGAVAPM